MPIYSCITSNHKNGNQGDRKNKNSTAQVYAMLETWIKCV